MLILSSKKGQVLIPPLGSCFILFPFLAYLHFNLIGHLNYPAKIHYFQQTSKKKKRFLRKNY